MTGPRTPGGRYCVRCAATGVKFATTWPEGSICRRCYQQATRRHGTCPLCLTPRLLPGRIGDTDVCTDCAGIPKDFHCSRCGREDEPVRVGLCAHCALTDDLTALLDDGTGRIAPALLPIYAALTGQTHARSATVWLITNPDAAALLRDLAQGVRPLEHATFTSHPHPRKVAFLHELFIEHQLLGPMNLDIERFQTWLTAKLSQAVESDARTITQYARWVHLNRMRHLAETGSLSKGTILSAKQSTTVALDFLAFLASRATTLDRCEQGDIDQWLADGPTTRSLARGFVRWAIEHRHAPQLEFPYRVAKTEPVLSQKQRLALIRLVVDERTDLADSDRAAAVLFLVFGQPLTRISRMTPDQIERRDQTIILRVTDDELLVPPPFDDILIRHLERLPHQTTAAHRGNTRWLFPGARPGQPVNQNTLMTRIRDAGIDLRAAHNATLRALVLDIPAAIVADSLGYSYQIADKHRRNSGATFIDYVNRRG